MNEKKKIVEVLTQEPVLPFEVTPAPDPEPAKVPEPVVDVAQEPKEPTTLDRLKGWLTQLVKDVTE